MEAAGITGGECVMVGADIGEYLCVFVDEDVGITGMEPRGAKFLISILRL